MDRKQRRIPWGKTYGDLWRHPKWLRLSDGAQALWASALSWTSETRSFGAVPEPMLSMWRKTPEQAAELVAVGLWETTAEGWQFHDWDDHQTPREAFEETSAKRATAGAKGGRARATKKSTTSGNKQTGSNLLSKSEASGKQRRSNGEADIDIDVDVDRTTPPNPPSGGHEGELFPAPEKKPTRRRTGVYSDDFETAWKAYPAPGRQAKKVAAAAYDKARDRADADTILTGIHAYAEYIERTGREVKYMQGWLNDDRWTDENAVQPQRGFRPTTEQNVAAAVDVAAYWAAQESGNVSTGRRLTA